MRTTCLLIFSFLILGAKIMASCQGESTIRKAQYAINGRSLYITHCQNCHGANGEGLGKLYPPLTDTLFLTNNRETLPCIIKHGLTGEITVNGTLFDTEMPPNPQLSTVDIAYILTYVGNSFGNESELYTFEEVENALMTNCR